MEPTAPGTPRRWRNWLIMGVFAAALGVLVFQALTSARVFFYNVDEAVADRQESEERRGFKLEDLESATNSVSA